MAASFEPIKYLKEIGFEWKEYFNYHINNTGPSQEEYLLIRKNDFLSSIPQNAVKIYVDINVWINFRDVHLGKKIPDPNWVEVYKKANILNELHDVYFVTSPHIFLELQKQKISEEYNVLLNIIGKLSKELTIENPIQLVFDETICCIADLLKVNPPFFDLKNYPWDKASAIFGIPLPQIDINNTGLVALNKTLIDAVYQIPFRDFKLFGQNTELRNAYGVLSDKLNLDLLNISGVRGEDIEKLFYEEFQGSIDANVDVIDRALTKFIKWQYPDEYAEAKIERERIINAFSSMFFYRQIKKYFPSLQIYSGLHASVRYDKAKKFSQNDLFDFLHASSAIPYCQYFITDNPLAQRLNTKPLEFGEKFGTRILSAKPDLVMQAFEEIARCF